MFKIGDKVRVLSVRDRGQAEVIDRVGSTGVIKANRVVDGSGVGYLVGFDDAVVAWFFERELAPA